VSTALVVSTAGSVVSAFTTVESVEVVSVVEDPPQDVNKIVAAMIAKNFFIFFFFC
jgi:hypothetical protein